MFLIAIADSKKFYHGSLHKGSQPTGPDEPPKGRHNADLQSRVGLAPSLCSLEIRESAMGKVLHFLNTVLQAGTFKFSTLHLHSPLQSVRPDH